MASRERHAQMKAPRLHNELLQVERGTRPKAKVVTLRDSRKINQHWLYQRTVLKGGRRLRAHYKGKQWLEWEYIALRHSRSPASGLKVALQYGRVCVCVVGFLKIAARKFVDFTLVQRQYYNVLTSKYKKRMHYFVYLPKKVTTWTAEQHKNIKY